MAEYAQPNTPTETEIRSEATFRERAGEELREFIVLTAYLYVCFAAVIYLKAAVLQAHNVPYPHLGLAIIKAAICAKFMLIGRAFHIGERFKNLPLIVPTLHRSFAFLLLLAVLPAIEEIVVWTVHGRTVLDSLSGIAGGTFHQTVAAILIINNFDLHCPTSHFAHSARSSATKYLCGYFSSGVITLEPLRLHVNRMTRGEGLPSLDAYLRPDGALFRDLLLASILPRMQ